MKNTERNTKRAPGGGSSSSASPSSTKKADPVENIGLAEIKELIQLVSENEFNEFELERGNFRLRLRKGGGREGYDDLISPSVVIENRQVESRPSTAVAAPAVAPVPVVEEEKLHIIASPIVGTFYRSPSPTADQFVKLGDQVEAGKTLCIIEAMKLMNEIQSDASGTIARIFVDNGHPVEYGQPLFGIKL